MLLLMTISETRHESSDTHTHAECQARQMVDVLRLTLLLCVWVRQAPAFTAAPSLQPVRALSVAPSLSSVCMLAKRKKKGKGSPRPQPPAVPPPAAPPSFDAAMPPPFVAPPAADTAFAPTADTAFAPAAFAPAASSSDASAASSASRRAARRAARKAGTAVNPASQAVPEITGGASEEVQYGDASFADTFVEDTSMLPLPTFDQFAARDRQQTADASAAAAADDRRSRARGSTPEPPKTSQEVARDRILSLLAFDDIDERPEGEEVYDWTARFIGRGLPNNAGAYILPYLQSGHLLLLGVLWLCTLISYPGFPLTEVPDEYRALLLQGLGLTFLVNTATAAYALLVAAPAKEEPAVFWALKCFLLGGLALGELTQAVPEPKAERYPNQRR